MIRLALHWFRNDLRLHDNTGLAEAADAQLLVPLFVFDSGLLAGGRQGAPRVRFLRACVEQLSRRLTERGSSLWLRSGDPRVVVPALARELRAERVTWNRDVTPYARRRDAAVRAALEAAGVSVRECHDRTVFDAAQLQSSQARPYTVYTPYRNAWWKRYASDPPEPAALRRLRRFLEHDAARYVERRELAHERYRAAAEARVLRSGRARPSARR